MYGRDFVNIVTISACVVKVKFMIVRHNNPFAIFKQFSTIIAPNKGFFVSGGNKDGV